MHEQMAQTALTTTPTLLTTPTVSRRVPYEQLTERESWACFRDGFMVLVIKWTAALTSPVKSVP